MKLKINHQGQALLPVIIVMAIVLVLGVGALHLSVGGMLISFSSREGETALLATEGALENGLMMILRNPSYAGESLQVSGYPCTITVSGQSPAVMIAECQSDRAIRRLQAEVSFIDGEMVVDNLQEIE